MVSWISSTGESARLVHYRRYRSILCILHADVGLLTWSMRGITCRGGSSLRVERSTEGLESSWLHGPLSIVESTSSSRIVSRVPMVLHNRLTLGGLLGSTSPMIKLVQKRERERKNGISYMMEWVSSPLHHRELWVAFICGRLAGPTNLHTDWSKIRSG